MSDAAPSASRDKLDQRFLTALPNLTDWAKHLITISSAILLLSAGMLRDLLSDVGLAWRLAIAVCLLACYVSLLCAIWFALRFVAQVPSMVLTMADHIVDASELELLATPFARAQTAFRFGMASFALLAVVILGNWFVG